MKQTETPPRGLIGRTVILTRPLLAGFLLLFLVSVAATTAASLAVIDYARGGDDASFVCGPEDVLRPSRHRQASPLATLAERLQRRACSISQEVQLAGRQPFEFDLIEADELLLPAPVDSNSPAFWHDDVLTVFNSAWYRILRSEGASMDEFEEPVDIAISGITRPGTAWIEAVWRDPGTRFLYGWYHFEPEDVECLTAPLIGAAVSLDEGKTWQDRGFVISNPEPVDCNYNNGYFTGGSGDFSVILGPTGRNLYILYSNYAGPLTEQGIGVARSRIEDKAQPGTVFKYFNGTWTEPGLGGRTTALFPSTTGWIGPHVNSYWGPSVHWNSYIESYVALLNHTDGIYWEQEGVYITFSSDLVTWTEPLRIMDSNDWYPQVLGLGPEETDTLAGQRMRVFIGGVSRYVLEFRAPESTR
jgi:hypothetical protein